MADNVEFLRKFVGHADNATDETHLLAAADEIEALREVKRRALELAEYIDRKARGLDDFGDLAAIPTQPWCELLALLTEQMWQERRVVSAESLLAEPRPGTLGHRLGARVEIDLRDIDTAHLLAEHRGLAAAHRQLRADYDADLDLLRNQIGRLTRERNEWEANEQEQARRADHLLELVVDAYTVIEDADIDDGCWLQRAAPIVGEAT